LRGRPAGGRATNERRAARPSAPPPTDRPKNAQILFTRLQFFTFFLNIFGKKKLFLLVTTSRVKEGRGRGITINHLCFSSLWVVILRVFSHKKILGGVRFIFNFYDDCCLFLPPSQSSHYFPCTTFTL
jgi:hypothetical protein